MENQHQPQTAILAQSTQILILQDVQTSKLSVYPLTTFFNSFKESEMYSRYVLLRKMNKNLSAEIYGYPMNYAIGDYIRTGLQCHLIFYPMLQGIDPIYTYSELAELFYTYLTDNENQ